MRALRPLPRPERPALRELRRPARRPKGTRPSFEDWHDWSKSVNAHLDALDKAHAAQAQYEKALLVTTFQYEMRDLFRGLGMDPAHATAFLDTKEPD
jgi:hypothetical protein